MSATLVSCFFDQSNNIQPLYLNVLLGIYMFSYIFLVCVLILFFSMFIEGSSATLTFKSTLATVTRFRLRWLLISIFASMAALPPSFFFFSKLSLLSSVVNLGGWFIFIFFLSYILLSWSIYYTVMRYSLFSTQVTSSSVLSKQRLSAKNACLAIFLFFFLFLTPFFFEDLYFFIYWLLV